ncbi:hypothetical protein [Bowmanella denitrificans]|uniref:hypothetical protein n=1 Tax=Bowmanella denitrificans TaxID=366582 RepID=UPI000C9C32EF|nr:hypothetical protein [Bowmanella denitrificans]
MLSNAATDTAMHFNATQIGTFIGILAVVVSLLVLTTFYVRNRQLRLFETSLCLLLGLFPPLNVLYAAIILHKNK